MADIDLFDTLMQRFSGEEEEEEDGQSFLNEFTTDLTKKAKEGKINKVIGRGKETDRLIQILSRKTKNNPVLVGEPGIGKTAIVEGLSQMIADKVAPPFLIDKRILSVDMTALVSGTRFRGDFEERIKRLIDEAKEDKNIIYFIDELHNLIGAGNAEGQMDAANMLKVPLSQGELQVIGTTTVKEWTHYIEKDAALSRRFQKILVEEPSDEEAVSILKGIKSQYEEFHGVKYSEDVLPLIVRLSKRYINERFLPDKAIDLLDEAGAKVKIEKQAYSFDIEELQSELKEAEKQKEFYAKSQDFSRAIVERDKARDIKQRLSAIKDLPVKSARITYKVTHKDVENIVSTLTGIPLDTLTEDEKDRFIKMERELNKKIIGQEEAIRVVSAAVRRNKAGLSSKNRPIGSFIFLGPTGVGKTQTAKALSSFIFGKEDALIRFDMSDYMEKVNVSRLIGAAPGYIGYEEGGVLTERVRLHPYSILLFDEIEKAHPDVFNLLLQVLEEGQLSDNLGHTVNFRNTIIIMTSNAGSRKITNEGRAGFNQDDTGLLSYAEIKASATQELKKLFPPELLNRIDEVVVFNALSRASIAKVLDLQLEELTCRLKEQNLFITYTSEVKEYLLNKGFDATMGARPLRRLIQREIEDPLSQQLLESANKSKDTVLVETSKEGLTFSFSFQKSLITSTEPPKITLLPPAKTKRRKVVLQEK